MKLVDIYYKSPYFIRYLAFVIKGAVQARNRYGKNFKSKYQELMSNENMSEQQIEILQNKLMKDLLQHAYENVPYYRKVFDNVKFDPQNYTGTEDLNKIPILTKEIIRENFYDLIASNISPKNMSKHSSGGTTEKPLQFYIPKDLKGDFNYATMYRFYSWAGVEFGERRVSVAGRMITKKPPYTMFNYAENQLYVSAHHLSNANLPDIVKSIIKFQPKFIQGHPSAIEIVSKFMINNDLRIGVKAVFTTSENLYKDQRQVIEEAFNCKVFDTYGMGEMVAMASECGVHNGYHLAPEYGFTEIVNTELYTDGLGEIISTSLQNYAMPLIRYKTGDLGKFKKEKCSCGSNFPMLDTISGRIDDLIELENGKKILPLSIRIQLKDLGIDDFQLIQISKVNFILNIFNIEQNKNRDYNAIKKEINELFIKLFDESSQVEVSFEGKKIQSNNGKIKMVIKG